MALCENRNKCIFMKKMKTIVLFSLFVLPVVFLEPLYGEQIVKIKENGINVLFEESLENAAIEVADICPGLITELEETLIWERYSRKLCLRY